MGGHGWGSVDDRELRESVAVALNLGVQLFDTADIYGLGASESLLGQALQGRRQKAFIATKFGVRHEAGKTSYDSSPAWIRTAAEGSLRRLQTDRIDLYQMHYWDGRTPLDDIAMELESLRSEGKILSYGVTNSDPRVPSLKRLSAYSYQYSLVHRIHEDLIGEVQKTRTDMVFMSWGSLGQGILSGAYDSLDRLGTADRRRRAEYSSFHGDRFIAVQNLLQELKIIAHDQRIPTLSQLALRWIVDHFPGSLPLVGIKRPSQIVDAAGILQFKLDSSTHDRIDYLTRQFKFSSSDK